METVGGKVTPASAEIERSRPLFVVGAPRSGTSLAYRALSLHPQAAYISNWLGRKPNLPVLSLLNRVPRLMPGVRSRYWFGENSSDAYRYGTRRPLLERVFPAPIEGGPVFEACGMREAQPPAEAAQASSLRAAFAALTRYGGGTTVVSKRIMNNRRLAFLAEVFPGARFVSIVRDGRAVAYSLSRVNWWEESDLWWFGGTPKQWREQGGDPWEACARTWVEEVRVIESGLAGLDPERVLRVSYEAMVANPLAELGGMARFCGLGESGAWTDSLGRLQFPNRNEAWRRKLDAEVVARIEGFQEAELRRLGYL
jgi:omega-hydroxy-beta-dihydromenaquinone-9 sulfotransferase